jgi:hypothetical protein
LRSRLADDKATEQFVSLLGLINREGFLGLEGLIEVSELLFLVSFLATVLSSGKLKKGLISFLTFTNAAKASLTLAAVPFCLTSWSNDVEEIFLIIPRAVGGHLELCPVGEFNLDLFHFPLLMKISRGNIRDGRPNGQHALLALGIFQAFRRGLEA